jgi:hypothetical protein
MPSQALEMEWILHCRRALLEGGLSHSRMALDGILSSSSKRGGKSAPPHSPITRAAPNLTQQ